MDFTFNNTNINAFFETGLNPPVSELIYLHTHPLVRPNFILQLEDQVLRLSEKRIPGKASNELSRIAISLGTLLMNIYDEQASKEILNEFRKSFILCNSLGVAIKP